MYSNVSLLYGEELIGRISDERGRGGTAVHLMYRQRGLKGVQRYWIDLVNNQTEDLVDIGATSAKCH